MGMKVKMTPKTVGTLLVAALATLFIASVGAAPRNQSPPNANQAAAPPQTQSNRPAPFGPGARGGPNGRGRGPAPDPEPTKILLWDNGAPGALGTSDADKPSVTLYTLPARGVPRPAVIVAPGGAYRFLSTGGGEGVLACYWLNLNGIDAALLRYRVTPYHYPIELDDAQRAIRLVRARAAEFGIDPDKIGMMGFSAGGHLTATAATHFDSGEPGAADSIDRVSDRLDFMILAYPVISFQPSIAGSDVLHAYAASGLNLLGANPDPKLLTNLSDELQVTKDTPPAFIVQGTADRLVSVQNSVAFYAALVKAGVPAELHTFQNAQHGFGINPADPEASVWSSLLLNWLKARGIVTPPPQFFGARGAAPPSPAKSAIP
jgi:acetyl esterase/lipase